MLSKKNLVTFSHYNFSFFHFNSLQKTVQLGLSGSSTTSLQHIIYICTTKNTAEKDACYVSKVW